MTDSTRDALMALWASWPECKPESIWFDDWFMYWGIRQTTPLGTQCVGEVEAAAIACDAIERCLDKAVLEWQWSSSSSCLRYRTVPVQSNPALCWHEFHGPKLGCLIAAANAVRSAQ